MRILVVSFAFPPFNCIGAVRVGKTVKALRRRGHEVRVLSATDQPFPPTLPLEIPEGEVCYTRWADLRRPTRGFRPAPSPSPAEPGAAATTAPSVHRASAVRYAASRLYGSLVFVPDAMAGWLPFAIHEGDRLVRDFRPDVILASAMPYTSLIVASWLAARHRVPWVAELRDLWAGHHAYGHLPFRRRLDRVLEARVLATAAGVVTVSEPLAEALRVVVRAPVATMLNGYDPEDWPADAAPPGGPGLTLSYTGNLLAGQRGPGALFQAMRRLDPGAVRVRFAGQTLTAVPDLAVAAGVQDAVTISGPVSYQESLAMQASSDALLFLLWDEGGRHGLYSGKIFEYLASRRPILALGPRNDVAEDLILGRGAGVVLEDADAIADQLGRWLDQKRRTGRVPPVPESARAGLSRDEQVAVLEDLLARAVRGRP